MNVQIRKATIADCGPILAMVNQLALRQILLPRSPASVIEHIRDFFIADVDGKFTGCGALHIVWSDLAEVRSIVVEAEVHKLGIGRALIDAMVAEANELGIPRLIAFTYEQAFFEKVGFHVVEHHKLPHKVFNDCLHCPKFTACDEIAMERVLSANGRDVLRDLGAPVTEFPMPVKVRRG